MTLKTDSPGAELGIYDGDQQLAYIAWPADRQLAATIHIKIQEILNKLSISIDQLEGIVCFKGPGSFTGLRIGLTVANALAYSYDIPIVATAGEDWVNKGLQALSAGLSDRLALPKYGAPAATPPPSK
ncbi:MAG: tRNA (adenosine(37)-N6)-threonylcarbamoyltransferase complex dimerization subunit type 1 TsaB [Candidatus Saccharimonadales bacterium]